MKDTARSVITVKVLMNCLLALQDSGSSDLLQRLLDLFAIISLEMGDCSCNGLMAAQIAHNIGPCLVRKPVLFHGPDSSAEKQ